MSIYNTMLIYSIKSTGYKNNCFTHTIGVAGFTRSQHCHATHPLANSALAVNELEQRELCLDKISPHIQRNAGRYKGDDD